MSILEFLGSSAVVMRTFSHQLTPKTGKFGLLHTELEQAGHLFMDTNLMLPYCHCGESVSVKVQISML
jgi:hypothetical protein